MLRKGGLAVFRHGSDIEVGVEKDERVSWYVWVEIAAVLLLIAFALGFCAWGR